MHEVLLAVAAWEPARLRMWATRAVSCERSSA